jgi:hypothetical protein
MMLLFVFLASSSRIFVLRILVRLLITIRKLLCDICNGTLLLSEIEMIIYVTRKTVLHFGVIFFSDSFVRRRRRRQK